ncbi:Acyloxyacyl Hydrolase [Manis pentadactyla]|nr:Acyloxyacyl Hydrolase [Manis pentadactyla]
MRRGGRGGSRPQPWEGTTATDLGRDYGRGVLWGLLPREGAPPQPSFPVRLGRAGVAAAP